jgi:hypothetical protein
MKKTWIVMAAALLLFARTQVFAESSTTKAGNCEFNGSKMVSSFDSNQVAVSVSEMEPGDSATFSVDILNSSDITTDWYMSNSVIQSLEEAQKVAANGGYTYILTYTDSASNKKTIYSSDSIGGEKSTEAGVGLNEATDSLKDFFYLVKLAPNEGGTVNLYVGLDGESQGNIYQDTLASLMMNFAVETPTYTYTTKTPTVQTGDKWIMSSVLMLLLGFAMLGYALVKSRKNSGKVKTLAALIFAAGVLTLAGNTQVQAAGYTYTVTISSGNQGKFTSTGSVQVKKADGNTASISVKNLGTKLKITGLEYGDIFSFRAQSAVTLSDNSKYYVKGIRLSGRDNNTVASSAFKVVEDQDYVVAYGIPGDLAEYTVNYLDADGNKLAESQKYFGNVGDEPVIAYLYIEGYVPASYNVSKVLSAKSTDNVFDFVYTKGGVINIVNEEGTAVTVNGGEAGAGGAAAGENGEAGAGEGAGAGEAGAEAGAGDEVILDENVPADGNADEMTPDADANNSELVIEDEDTPTGANPFEQAYNAAISSVQTASQTGVLIPILVGALALLGVMGAIVYVIKKNQKSE